MKIALITIHNVTNYGAILQTFATKEVLSQYGEVKIIDYRNKHLSHHMHLIRFKPSISGIKMTAHDVLNFFARSKMISRFKKFIDQNMELTDTLTTEELIKGKAGGFDLYVCGSDQIWNPGIVSPIRKLDPVFFLSFVPKGTKKISYASSIGHHQFTESEKKLVKKLLEDFSSISVRENDGRDKLLELFPEKKIQVVFDPTLLIAKSEWLQKFNIKEEKPPKEYILVYSVPRTELIKKAIFFFSKKLNYSVVTIDKMFFPITKVDKHTNNAGPKEFLELYANASFVITDSFHGLCYSLNFEKPFVAVSANKAANRQENLLNLLGIRERLMYDEQDFRSLEIDIDYRANISKKLEALRKESLAFIDSAILGKNQMKREG